MLPEFEHYVALQFPPFGIPNDPKWICWGPWIAEDPKREGTHTQHTQAHVCQQHKQTPNEKQLCRAI